MKTTTNYGLKKPDGTDLVNIEDLNSNMDVIDTQLAAREGLLKNAVAKTTLADTDTIPLSDSAASSATKKITFANMKAVLKSYFDGLYNKYTHPAYTPRAAGLYKITVDSTGHTSAATAVAKADITALGIPAQDTVTPIANNLTTTVAGKALDAVQGKLLDDRVTEVGTALNKATLLSDETAGLFGLSGADATVSNAIKSLTKKQYAIITTSQNWTVPDSVTEVDVLLCTGGFDGGVTPSPGYGGGSTHGGAAGVIDIFIGIPVVPKAVIPIIVGGRNGGSCAFKGMFSFEHTQLAHGGTPAADGGSGGSGFRQVLLNNTTTIVDGYFPIPLNYCVAGAAPGWSYSFGKNQVGAEGKKGTPPTGGGPPAYAGGDSATPAVGGGGASVDNDGRGKDGGDAITPGCGGGGAGYTGVAGKGAPGFVIIRY